MTYRLGAGSSTSSAIHADCDVIHTADADFDELDEIETRVHR